MIHDFVIILIDLSRDEDVIVWLLQHLILCVIHIRLLKLNIDSLAITVFCA